MFRGEGHLPALSQYIDPGFETVPETLQAACTDHCVSWHGRLGSAAALRGRDIALRMLERGGREGYLGGEGHLPAHRARMGDLP